MAKYAPNYMSVYDGPDYALSALTLSANTMAANAAENTVVGNIVGAQTEDSVLTLANDDGGRFKLVGLSVRAGATASGAGTRTIVVRETNPYGSNSPRDTSLNITVS